MNQRKPYINKLETENIRMKHLIKEYEKKLEKLTETVLEREKVIRKY